MGTGKRYGLALVFASVVALQGTRPADAGIIFDAHKWRWQDLMSHAPALKKAGYSAILLSPHQKSCGGGFSDGYDPYDYKNFDSRFGNQSDLFWLIGTAHWFGMHVYADMVMNHMCPLKFDYPRFSWGDFHHNGGVVDWNDPWWVENGDLLGLSDLAHESSYVRSELFAFLVKTNNLGIDGYRWDAAKHVPIWFWRDHILNNVKAWGKYSFGEVWSGDLGLLNAYVGAGMSVTDYALYDVIQRAFRLGGNLAELSGAGLAAQNGGAAQTFVENHDTGPPPNRHLAYAFLATYPGYPSFYNVSPTDAFFQNLVWIHNNFAHGAYRGHVAERDVLVFEREGHLLVALNQSSSWTSRWVATPWKGTRLHDHSGRANDIWTGENGWVEVFIPPQSFAMFAPS